MEGIVELMVGGLGWTVVVGEIRGFGCFRVLHLVLLMMILSCMVLFRPTAASPYVCTDNFTSLHSINICIVSSFLLVYIQSQIPGHVFSFWCYFPMLGNPEFVRFVDACLALLISLHLSFVHGHCI
jgi:hypothetical protein